MSGPPDNIEASALWLALTSIPRPTRVVDIPRKNADGEPAGQVAIWPMTQQEQMECNAAAERFAKESLKVAQKKDEENIGYHHTFGNETAVQVLWRVCRNPQDLAKPAFPSPKAVRMAFTGDEIGVLYNQYLATCAELGPIIATMTDDEMEAWVKRLAEGSTMLPFELLSWDAQRTLVRFMVDTLAVYWTDRSSATSPLDESSFETGSEGVAAAGEPDVLPEDTTEPVTSPDPNG